MIPVLSIIVALKKALYLRRARGGQAPQGIVSKAGFAYRREMYW